MRATLQATAITLVGLGALGLGLYELTGADANGSFFRAAAGFGGYFLVWGLATAFLAK